MPAMTSVVEIIVSGTVPPSSGGTKPFLNVFHYRLLTGTMDTMTQLIGDFESQIWSFVAARLSIDYTGQPIKARVIDDALSQFVLGAASANGVIALPRLPTELAVVTPYNGAQRGRNFRGSKHFGPIASASVVKDELIAGEVTAWQAVAVKLGTTLTSITGTYRPIILSRTLSQLRTNPTSIIGSDVTSVVLNKTLGTMRHRKEKTVR